MGAAIRARTPGAGQGCRQTGVPQVGALFLLGGSVLVVGSVVVSGPMVEKRALNITNLGPQDEN